MASGPARPAGEQRRSSSSDSRTASWKNARPKDGALVVLDSWALLAFLNDEPSAERIEGEWLANGAAISAINLGEVLYIRIREHGEISAATDVEMIREQATVVDPDWQLTVAAAKIKAKGGLAYADAFCVATAERLSSPVWTGNPEIVNLAEHLACEIIDLRRPGN